MVMGGSGVVMGVTSDYKWVQVVMGGYGVVLVVLVVIVLGSAQVLFK